MANRLTPEDEQRRAMRVLIIDPSKTLREALCELFDGEPDMHPTATDSVSAADSELCLGSVDVVVVDERIAGALSAGAQAALARLAQHALVVVTGLGDPEYYENAHAQAGAVGYWPKHGDVEPLVDLVRAAGLVARADRAVAAQTKAIRRLRDRCSTTPQRALMGAGEGA
jgi:DNA-binding NarL/FixJ family response regulator